MNKSVYLAGPITGLGYQGATDWREWAKAELNAAGIAAYSPMRGKEYLRHVKEFTMDGDKYKPLNVLSSNRGITTRDRWDATRCGALLVNLLGAPRVSIGTMIELGWADSARIPIVGVMEPEGNLHDHGMVLELLGFRTPSLPEAIQVIKAMFAW